jgi:hypothetical protein
MISSRRSAHIILLLFCVFCITCDSSTWEGTLTLRGNEPHTRLVLTTGQGISYELTGPLAGELSRHQYRKVIIRGKMLSGAAGPGFPAKIQVDKIVDIGSR